MNQTPPIIISSILMFQDFQTEELNFPKGEALRLHIFMDYRSYLNSDLRTHAELQVGLLIKVNSGDHMSRLFFHVKYRGRI